MLSWIRAGRRILDHKRSVLVCIGALCICSRVILKIKKTKKKQKRSNMSSQNISDAGAVVSLGEKAVMKKALNAILFIAAGWALNTGTHSLEEAERRCKRNSSLWAIKHKSPLQRHKGGLLRSTTESLNAICDRCWSITSPDSIGAGEGLRFLRQPVWARCSASVTNI